MSLLAQLFKRDLITRILDEQLYDAQRRLLDHEAAAEHHGALAEMYRRRVQRLLHATVHGEGDEVVNVAGDVAPIELRGSKRLRA